MTRERSASATRPPACTTWQTSHMQPPSCSKPCLLSKPCCGAVQGYFAGKVGTCVSDDMGIANVQAQEGLRVQPAAPGEEAMPLASTLLALGRMAIMACLPIASLPCVHAGDNCELFGRRHGLVAVHLGEAALKVLVACFEVSGGHCSRHRETCNGNIGNTVQAGSNWDLLQTSPEWQCNLGSSQRAVLTQ